MLYVRNEYDQISCVFFGCVVVLNQSPRTQIQKGAFPISTQIWIFQIQFYVILL